MNFKHCSAHVQFAYHCIYINSWYVEVTTLLWIAKIQFTTQCYTKMRAKIFLQLLYCIAFHSVKALTKFSYIFLEKSILPNINRLLKVAVALNLYLPGTCMVFLFYYLSNIFQKDIIDIIRMVSRVNPT